MARQLRVELIGDASSLNRALSQASGGSSKFGSALAVLGKAAVVGLGAVGVGAVFAGKKMVDLASDAAEVDSKMQVVFGKTLPGLTKNLNTFSEATGASRFQLREQAADMGALLAPLLGTKQAAAGMSEQFVKLATDLGSFNNVPVGDALLAIRSGLVGEAEPLRRFGVLLNEGAVKAEAYRLGLAKVGEVLTEQEKVQARASLIMKQTSLAQGDATRTAGSMANQMKALKNTITDTATELGTRLLPVLLPVLTRFNEFLDGFFKERTISGKLKFVWEGIEAVAGDLWDKIVVAWNGDQRTIVMDLGERVEVVGQEGFKAKLGQASEDAQRSMWEKMKADSKQGVADFWQEVSTNTGPINAAGRMWTDTLRAAMFGGIRALSDSFNALLKEVFVDPFVEMKSLLIAAVRDIMGSFVTVFTSYIPIAAGAAVTLGTRIVSGVSGALSRIGGAVREKLDDIIPAIRGVGASALSAAGDIGRGIASGIVAGIGGLKDRLIGALGSALSGALGAIKGRFGIESPSKWTAEQIGEPLAEGIIEGLTETLAGRLPKNLGGVLTTAMNSTALGTSAAAGGTGIGVSLKGGIDDFLEAKLPDNLAQILGLATSEAMAKMDFSQSGLGVSWTAVSGPVAPMPVGLGPSRLADPDAGATVVLNNYAPINSERQLEDMIVAATARVRGRGGLA